jgi:MFS family permease
MSDSAESRSPRFNWVSGSLIGIILATFFSDVSHEMCTAVLPLFLASIHLGPAALGMIEGLSDLLLCLSKLGGGVVGHRIQRKRHWASLGFLVTALATAAIALVQSVGWLLSLRGIAWISRGFRSPLRDALLADAVEPTHYGRAYGLERTGDMLGAIVGPLLAALLVWQGIGFQTIILWTLLPGLLAAGAMFFMAKERNPVVLHDESVGSERAALPRFPRVFWMLLIGVFLFGMGDFSRTLLIWLAADRMGDSATQTGVISVAVLLYAMHNVVSAAAAYPIGRWGDRDSKLRVLLVGYFLGVVTNLLLALSAGSLTLVIVAIVLSGVYIAVEETIEKSVAAELLPRELRSLGFGILAGVNAVGDMASSLYVGLLLEAGRPQLAFGVAASFGILGVCWLASVNRSHRSKQAD